MRAHLWHYGIGPRGRPWRAAWSWASAIANSYFHISWPSSTEIATQYVLLLLVEMKESCALRLPYRASKVISEDVKAMLPGNPAPLLIQEPLLTDEKPKIGQVAE